MRYPIRWLRQFANPACTDDELVERLTMAGLEVEIREEYGNASDLIVVGEVISASPHPQADRLKICQVRINENPDHPLLNIVCGAPNVVVGMKAPLAMMGAMVQGKPIVEASLRGVISQGMLCSAEELMLGDLNVPKGLLVLPQDSPVGKPLHQALPTHDTLLTIKLTPNRGDCLSMLGLAREVAALTYSEISIPLFPDINIDHDETLAVDIEDFSSCPIYAGRIINKVSSQAETPLWMKVRLVQCGERPINPLVDITNYVMLEWGQPMHAFDRKKLKGAIGVRRARASESLTLLNHQKINVGTHDIVITDDDRPVALAGVMGGEDTAIQVNGDHPESLSVFFEAAHFVPVAVQGRAKAYGLSSQAAYRFERGVDPHLPEKALARATELTLSILGGQAGAQSIFIKKLADSPATVASKAPQCIPFRLSRAKALMGYDYTAQEVERALQALGFKLDRCDHETEIQYVVQVPSWRFDIHIEEDLIEEVARMVGYDNIHESLPKVSPALESNTEQSKKTERSHWDIIQLLANMGYRETQHFGFIAEETDRRFCEDPSAYRPIRLANPIAENLNVMRGSLMGSLVETCAYQARSQVKGLRLFELARVFQWKEEASNTVINSELAHQYAVDIFRAGGRYHQPYHMAMLAWGLAQPWQWGTCKQEVDFFDLKGDFESVVGNTLHTQKSEEGWRLGHTQSDNINHHPALHPTRSAPIIFQGVQVGWIGELHPIWVRHYHLSSAPILLECEISSLTAQRSFNYQPLCRQPMVERDISVWLPLHCAMGAVRDDLLLANIPYLQEVVVFDVYGGDATHSHSADQKSVAIRFWLQDRDKTLEESVIFSSMNVITQRLKTYWQAKLREDLKSTV